MKRTILLLSCLLIATPLLWSQDTDVPFDPANVLSPLELSQEKIYYSLEEAMKEPEKVYKLSLTGQKIKSLPDDFYRLINLHTLDLSNTKLAAISDDISKLQYLQFLNLYNNRISFLPSNLQDLSQLHTLYLGRNKLVEIPAWVGGLGKLRILDIAYNRLNPREVASLQYQLPNCLITY